MLKEKKSVFRLGSALVVLVAIGIVTQNRMATNGYSETNTYDTPSHDDDSAWVGTKRIRVTQVESLQANADATQNQEFAALDEQHAWKHPGDIVAEARENILRLDTAASSDLGCRISMTALVSSAAMVDLLIESPCHTSQRVELEHAGLRFTEETDGQGFLGIGIPVLTENAIFTAKFPDGTEAVAQVSVPAASEYFRASLQWTGNEGFQLHAYEDGAGFTDEGHVSSLSPKSPMRAVEEKGGFLTVLGSVLDGHMADVYSYPRALVATQAPLDLDVEVEIGRQNCNREIEGSLMVHGGRNPGAEPIAINLVVPDCSRRGDYLVLKNPVPDLKIARN